jgi:hypothetical protein
MGCNIRKWKFFNLLMVTLDNYEMTRIKAPAISNEVRHATQLLPVNFGNKDTCISQTEADMIGCGERGKRDMPGILAHIGGII